MPRKTVKSDVRDDRRRTRKYNSGLVARFIGRMMLRGKKSVGQRHHVRRLESIKEKAKQGPSRGVHQGDGQREAGGRGQVAARRRLDLPGAGGDPRGRAADALAMRWLIPYARSRGGRTMSEKLAARADGRRSTRPGAAFKKKEDTHRWRRPTRPSPTTGGSVKAQQRDSFDTWPEHVPA